MRVLIVLLCLTRLAWAEVRPVVVSSFPPGVELYRAADGPEGRVLVGRAGAPVLFASEWFRDPQGRSSSMVLYARAPGHVEQKVMVDWESLPAGLRVELAPQSFWVGLQDQLRYRPAVLVGPVLAGLILAGLAGLARGRRLAAARQLEALRAAQADLQADASDPYLGKHFGPFVLTRRLGVGGMGFVYRASGPDGEVALKVIRPELSQEPEFRDRFWREITLAGKLNHRGIVKVFSCDVQDGLLYYAMELISGHDLTHHVVPGGLELESALDLILPTLEALGQAHKAGIVHRDLKPSNILLADSGRVVLMDFGLAKSPDSPPLTATGAALGTPAYMAPEQIMGRLDKRSDQYALGIVLYELLCGRRPFLESDMSVIWKHVSEAVPAPRSFRPDLPPEIEELLLRMLAKDPEDRFEELEDVRVALAMARRLR